jgi:outer membrane autotransporter protein
VWGGAYGGDNRTDGDAAVVGSHDLSARAAGFAAGADYRMTPSTTLGFALAGGNSSWSLAQGLGGGRNDAFQAGLYGRTTSGAAYISAAFAAAEHWLSTSRTALGGGQLSARFTAQSYGGRLEAGYRLAAPVVAVTPYAALQMQAFTTPFYSETDASGAGLDLSYAGRVARDARGEVGVRLDRIMALNGTTLVTLRGRLAYAHDWISDPALTAAFQTLPGASFVVTGAAPARDSLLTSAGAELWLASDWALAARFDGELATHSRTYTGTGTLRYTW